MTRVSASTQHMSKILRGGRMTKWKGKVASLSPHVAELAAGVSLPAFVAALALALPDAALAGTCTPGAGVFTCAGPADANTDVTQTIGLAGGGGGPVTVVTAPGFGIDTSISGGDAIQIAGSYGTIFRDVNGSAITGGDRGVYANNYIQGSLSITTSGVVAGQGRSAVYGFNGAGTDALTINTVDTIGATSGIDARNFGYGDTIITSTGTALGTAGDGVYIYNNSAGNVLSTTANSRGGQNGIHIINNGAGSNTTVTSTGTATGDNNDGIFVNSGADTGAVDITSNMATGGNYGIRALNYGTGATTITSTGTATGTTLEGIYVRNSAAAIGNVTVTANNSTGALAGIDARNFGMGALSVTSMGTATATAAGSGSPATVNDGIFARNDSGTSLTVSANNAAGGNYGIRALNYGTGATTVTSMGAVTGTMLEGVYVRNSAAAAGNVTVTANNSSGALAGIDARNLGIGALSVTSTGTATATAAGGGMLSDGILAVNYAAGTDLTVSANNATGGNFGIRATNFGTGDLTITSAGAVVGTTGNGVYARNGINPLTILPSLTPNSDLILNLASVTGGTNGIYARNFAAGEISIMASGTVTGMNGDGIYARAEASSNGGISITSTGTARSVATGPAAVLGNGIQAINYGSGAILVNSTGLASSANADGIYTRNEAAGSSVTVMSNNATGANNGIRVINNGAGATSIMSGGNATGTANSGIFASNTAAGTSVFVGAANASGAFAGVDARNFGAGGVTVMTTGTVTGTLTTAGVNSYGIRAFNVGGGGISVTSTGAASGATADGIYARQEATGTGNVMITSNNATGARDGIRARNYGLGGVTVMSTGTATGGVGHDGIYARQEDNGTTGVMVTSNISIGNRDGIRARNYGTGGVTVISNGTTTGTTEDGIYARQEANGTTGVMVTSNIATGGRNGIYTRNYGRGGITITSSGAASGANGNGIRAVQTASGTGDVMITSNNATGSRTGIYARIYGAGGIIVNSTGVATSTTEHGIYARSDTAGTGGIAIMSNTATGDLNGIRARNYGLGTVTVMSTGVATGTRSTGIDARNGAMGTGGVAITSNTATGDVDGIRAANLGGGGVTVTSNGLARGTNGVGISASNSAAGTGLTVTALDSSGAISGINATGNGRGLLTIDSNGTATGTGMASSGIVATTGAAATGVLLMSNNSAGGASGILAIHRGTGDLAVQSDGLAQGGTLNGIYAGNGLTGHDVTVTALNTTGGANGIRARNFGNGLLMITSTGTARGTGTDGIYGYNSRTGTDLMIASANATGGNDGILANNSGTGLTTVISNGTATGGRNGIEVLNSAAGAVRIDAVDTMGGRYGIVAVNTGTGATTITSTGTATGTTLEGIYALNTAAAIGGITINAANATGSFSGIDGRNLGGGGLTINASGAVTSTANIGIIGVNVGGGSLQITSTGTVDGVNVGINAQNSGTNLTISAVDVTGGTGIFATNFGSGPLSVTSTGTVTGDNGDGIYARGEAGSTGAVGVHAANTMGARDGIRTRNYGTGATVIDATGTATGGLGSGIFAQNGAMQDDGTITAGGTDLTIMAANTTGADSGIEALNFGTGATTVTSAGTAMGTTGSGIFAQNGAALADGTVIGTELTIMAANTSGGSDGITASNFGAGPLTIDSTGTATGTGRAGIFAQNLGDGLAVTARDTIGGDDGINAQNHGTGALTVRSTGTATSTRLSGIYAYNIDTGTDLTVTANNVTGGTNGILAVNDGTGVTAVSATGTVRGGNNGAGIATVSNAGSAVTIDVASTADVAATSGMAIMDGAGDSAVTIRSGAKLSGAINLGDGNDTLTIESGTSLANVTLLSGDLPPAVAVAGRSGLAGDVDTLNLRTGFDGNLSDFETINLDSGGGSFTLGGAISNATSLTKTGANTVSLSGTNTFTGPTTVTGGSLDVTGSIASSAVTLQAGAALLGSGTVGALTAQSGSTISPGSTPGAVATLTVNGNLTLSSGSIVAIDAAPSATGATIDQIVVRGGTATLGGTLNVTAAAGTQFGQTLTVVSANTVSGSFASTTISGSSAFRPLVSIGGSNVTLTFAPNSLVTLGGASLGGNRLAFANAFDAAVNGGFNPQGFMPLLSQGTNTAAALAQFTGEIHAVDRRVALEDTRVVREAALGRLRGQLSGAAGSQAVTHGDDEKTVTLWTQGIASHTKADADTNAGRFTSNRTGSLTGVDVTAGNLTFGALVSYVSDKADLARLDKANVKSLGAALYAGYRQEGAGFAAGIGGAIAHNRFADTRTITVPGITQTLNSRTNGTTYQVFGEVSYNLAKADSISLEPFVRLAYARLDAKGFTETGGSAAVTGGKRGSDLTTTIFGVRGSHAIGSATFSGSAGYQNASGDRSTPTAIALSGVTAPYTVRSAALDKSAAALEADASFRLAPRVTLGVGYSGVIGSHNTDHGGRATLTFKW